MTKKFKPLRGALIDLDKVTWPMFMSPKLDGIRALVDREGVISKNLLLLPQPAVQRKFWHGELAGLEGELIVGHPTDPDIYNTTMSFVMSKSEVAFKPEAPGTLGPYDSAQTPCTFYVFDDVSIDPNTPFRERLDAIRARVKALQQRGFAVEVVPQIFVGTKELAVELYERFLDDGYEGAIFRSPNGIYKYGQSTLNEGFMLKWKPKVDFTAQVLDVYESMANNNEAVEDKLGHTKRSSHKANKVGKGTLGGVVAKDLETGETFRCGIFQGLKKADLQKLWDEHNSGVAPLIGRYFDAYKMGYGQKVRPRHPRWFRWRDAKDVSLPD